MISDKEEGFRALFKGGPARVLRSSPQFGFTLLGKSFLLIISQLAAYHAVLIGYETLKTFVSVAYFYLLNLLNSWNGAP